MIIRNSNFTANAASIGGSIYNDATNPTVDATNNYWLISGTTFGPVDRSNALSDAIVIGSPPCDIEPPEVQIPAETGNSCPPNVVQAQGVAGALNENDECPAATPTQFPFPTITNTPTPEPTILEGYNVYVLGESGVDISGRKQAVNNGVLRTGQAFKQLLDANNLSNTSDIYGDGAFRRVFLDNSVQYPDSNAEMIAFIFVSNNTGGCLTTNFNNDKDVSTFSNTTVRSLILQSVYGNRPHLSVIVCDINLNFVEQTAVHELGHVLDRWIKPENQDGFTLTNYLGDEDRGDLIDFGFTCTDGDNRCNLETFDPVTNGKSRIVMGFVSSDGGSEWSRGERGWGSGPSTINGNKNFSQFQQNPPPYTDVFKARFETIADLFLNWVYRYTDSENPNGTPRSNPDYDNLDILNQWEGFLEKSWLEKDARWGVCNTENGCIDYSYPGYVRFEWTFLTLESFVTSKLN